MDDHPALRIVQPGETVQVQAPAGDALIIVTDRRMAVANAQRLMLDVPIEGLRRIQFDIERRRPATLVIVPEDGSTTPQVLAIEPAGKERSRVTPRTGPAPNRHRSRVTASGPSPWPMPRHRGAREADADRPEGRRRGRRALYACTRPVSETGWAVCVSQMNVQDPSDTRASLNVGYQGQTNWSTQ
jgi:hypothetical protein